MEFVYQIILVLFFAFSLYWFKAKKMDSASKTVLSLFVFLWFFSLFIAVNRVNGKMYLMSSYTFFLLTASVIFFVIGFNTININPQCNIDFGNSEFKVKIENVLQNRLFQVLIILLFFYMLYLYSIFLTVKESVNNLAELRTMFFSGEMFSHADLMIGYYFKTPLLYLVFPLCAYCCIYKRNWLWVLMLIILYIESSLSGGRLGYIRCFVFPLIFVGIVFRNGHTSRVKVLFYMLILALVVLFLITCITAMRSGHMEITKEVFVEAWDTTKEHLVSYFAAPSVAFDQAIQLDYVDRIGGYSWGAQTFSAFETLFNSIVRRIGIIYESPLQQLAELKQNTPISLGDDGDWNALYTWNLMFYMDFGIVGVMVFPYMFGRLMRKLIKIIYNKHTIVSFCFCYMLFDQIALSPMDFRLANMGIIFAFAYFYLFDYLANKKITLR